MHGPFVEVRGNAVKDHSHLSPTLVRREATLAKIVMSGVVFMPL